MRLDRKEIDPAEIKSLTKNDILSSIIELHLEEKGQLKNKELDKINEPIKDNNLEDEVKVYLKEIGKIPLFTPEEEISFFERLEEIKLEIEEKPERKKDFEKIEKFLNEGEISKNEAKNRKIEIYKKEPKYIEQKNKIVERNLRLVVSMAKAYLYRGLPFIDLIQEGNLGLMKAVDKFETERGNKFSTYATWWIRQTIRRAICDQSRIIRIPVHMVERIDSIRYTMIRMEREIGYEPSIKEITEEYNNEHPNKKLTEEQIRHMVMWLNDVGRLDTPVGDENDATLGDFIPDESDIGPQAEADLKGLQEAFKKTFKTLTPRETNVLIMRFGLDGNDPKTLEEIGKEFNVTRERIRQIEAKAKRKVKDPSRAKYFKDYIDISRKPIDKKEMNSKVDTRKRVIANNLENELLNYFNEEQNNSQLHTKSTDSNNYLLPIIPDELIDEVILKEYSDIMQEKADKVKQKKLKG